MRDINVLRAVGKLAGSWIPSQQWQRNQYLIVLTVFLNFIGFNFVMPFLPLYVQELGITEPAKAAFWSGLILSAAPLVGMIVAPIWGILTDRFGAKPMLLRAMIGFSVLMYCNSLVTDVYQMLGLRLLWGALGGFTPMTTAMITLEGPRERIGRGLGLLQAGQAISFAVGPLLGGLLADQLGLRRSFYVPTVLYVICVFLVLFFYKQTYENAPAKKRAKTGGRLRDILRAPAFLPILAVLFCTQFVDKSYNNILPLFIASLEPAGTSIASLSGITIALGAVAATVSATAAGRLSGARSIWRFTLLSVSGGAILCVPLAFVNASWELMVGRFLLGLMVGGTQTLAYTAAGLSVPASVRTTAFGLLASALLFGSAAGPPLNGMLAGISLRAVFLANALLYGIAAMVIVFALRARGMDARPVVSIEADKQG